MFRNLLCDALTDRASMIHDLLTFSYARKTLGVSEETISEITLLELDRRLWPHVITRKFNKREESTSSGADWMWTIGRPGKWLSIVVQAKLVRPTSRNIPGLHHKQGGQLNKLTEFARIHRCLPLYVVYNNRPPQGHQPTCGLLHGDPKQMGSVIVRTRHVANMLRLKRGRSSVQNLLSAGTPWACLFCCPTNTNSELADVVAAAVARLPMPDRPQTASQTRAPGQPEDGAKSHPTMHEPRGGRDVPSREPTGPENAEKSAHAIGRIRGDHDVPTREPTRRHQRPRTPVQEGGGFIKEPDDFLGAPDALITERAPEFVEALLKGEPVRDSPVNMVSVISSEPLPILQRRGPLALRGGGRQ